MLGHMVIIFCGNCWIVFPKWFYEHSVRFASCPCQLLVLPSHFYFWPWWQMVVVSHSHFNLYFNQRKWACLDIFVDFSDILWLSACLSFSTSFFIGLSVCFLLILEVLLVLGMRLLSVRCIANTFHCGALYFLIFIW